MKGIIIQQTDIHEIEVLLRSIVREELARLQTVAITTPDAKNKSDEPFLTRKEAAQLLKISPPTFTKILREGFIKAYRIGNRIKFKQSDLLSSVSINRKNIF